MLIAEDRMKETVYERSKKYWNPEKTDNWRENGVDLVIDKREGYYLYDISGKKLMDLHLNGGTYNFGHRNQEIINTLTEGMSHFDIGNHHFPSILRAKLAEEMFQATPENLQYSIFASGGGEAIDIAIKCARNATKRKKIISIKYGYHGHTGLALPLGNERYSKLFLSEGDPEEFIHVPFNDLEAMEKALQAGDAAAVIIETIPATYGFPMPNEGYLQQIKSMCESAGTLYIADEVQTGLQRSGKMWAIECYGIQPDILVTAKGLSGGIYPIAATVVSEEAGQWLHEDGFAHISTFGGSELGCLVALKVLEMSQNPDIVANAAFVADYLRNGLNTIQSQYSDYFSGVRQLGLIMGLEFLPAEGAKQVMRSLYDNGVWAIYSMLDPKVLQFKPGLLCDKAYCDDLLARVETGIKQAKYANASSIR